MPSKDTETIIYKVRRTILSVKFSRYNIIIKILIIININNNNNYNHDLLFSYLKKLLIIKK